LQGEIKEEAHIETGKVCKHRVLCCGPRKLQGEIKEEANTEIDKVLQIKLHPL
jgi:hypothetical protein